jgi:peroxiredoxin
MSQIAAGHTAPDFELRDLSGAARRLSDALRTGPVGLVFYKESCPTCEFTFPHLQRIFEMRNLKTFWGISQDDEEETRHFAERFGVTFDLLIDEHPYRVSAAYEIEFVPAMFLIEPNGTIALSECGFSKDGLNQMAGFELLPAADKLPSFRPGCRSKN